VNEWRTLQRVPIGGEALPGEIADKFHATFDSLLHNFYGPTETVLNCTRFKVEGKQGTRIVPIGTPKINTTIHLLDEALQPVPVGVIGEIYIGGTHVARYHERPGLTAERFVADPFNPGGRMYRSGDLARRNSDGDVEFVGRADEQVKVRGFRIELGEVSAAISVDPSVGQAVVVVSDLPTLGKSLVAYITPAADADVVEIDRIRARVAAALPEYMTPAAYVAMDEIPITANGKIDRRALPEPEIRSTTEFREPANDTERQLAELFAELLDRDQVGADDSFFELGGHSLLATKLVAAVRTRCGVDVGVQDVFELATVAAMAAHVDELAASGGGTGRPPIAAIPHAGPLQMSAAQLRQWFQFRIDGPNPVNNIPFAARVTGPSDPEALVAAINDVIERHEILRTTYTEIDGAPYQVINPAAPLMVRRARGADEEWLQHELDTERKYCFELETDWPIRAAVLSTPEHHVLSIVVHHLAADHWSAGVLFTDILTSYRARRVGEAVELPALPVQYADFAAWQAGLLADEGEAVVAQREYWTQQLAGLPEENGLRPDFPRPPVPSGGGDALGFTIDGETRAKLTELTRELGVTEFMLLQAAVAVALHAAGEGVDIPLGTPVAGRTEPQLEQLIGFFINIVVLRNDLAGNPTLREVLRRAREMALAAYKHQDLPFDRVVDAVSPVRSLSRNPLFGVVVHVREDLPADRVIDSGPDGETRFTALEPTFDVAHADLSLNFFAEADAGYKGTVIYRTELYERATAQRLVSWLHRVIAAFADDADQTLRDITVIEPAERRRIVEDWSRTAVPPEGLPQTQGATGVYVLDEWLEPTAIGVIGDVYYAGGAVDDASANANPAAATRFLPNPFATGTRVYRTGDRARWTDDGRLEVVDAGDHRVQTALEAVEGVAAAATRAWPGRVGTALAGYVVPDRQIQDAAERIRFAEQVRAALPEDLVPPSITVVDAVDRNALTRPVFTNTAPTEPVRTDTERALAAVLVDVLGVSEVGRNDDFFTLGGDSILAVQLAARARDTGIALTARMVFEHPEIAELATAIDEKAAAGGASTRGDAHHAPMAASGLSSDELAALTAGWSDTRDGTT
jgi:mycobactin peptide synthetase MbtE